MMFAESDPDDADTPPHGLEPDPPEDDSAGSGPDGPGGDDAASDDEASDGEPAEPEPEPARKVPAGSSSKKAAEDPDAELIYTDLAVPSRDELEAAMRAAFEAEDIEEHIVPRFVDHAELVLAGNQEMNLTAIVDPKEVAVKHYLDCWRATRLLPLMGRKVLDLGTGAGFPGIPVALAEPQCKVVLVDSTKKRIDFVQRCIDELKIKNATAVWERGEEHLARNSYDLVMMRAISSVRENVRLLRKVKHSHKDVVMLKAQSWSREVRAAEREAERLGFHLDTVWEHELPEGLGQRAILVYRAPGGQGL